MNTVIWNNVLKGATSFIVSKSIIVGIGYMFGCAALIFWCGLLIEYIRIKLAKFFKISSLSEKIVNWLNRTIIFASMCLK